MSTWNVAICDDEKVFFDKLSTILADQFSVLNQSSSIDLYASGEELLSAGKDYDIVFLDIDFKSKKSGIETALLLHKRPVHPYIVFITAYANYALDGYRAEPLRYIMKDNKTLQPSIQECLEVIIQREAEKHQRLMFSFVEGKSVFDPKDLIYVESNLHRLTFHFKDNSQYTMYERLSTIEKELYTLSFYRIHQSYLLNLHYVKTVQKDSLILNTNVRLPISRSKKIGLEKRLISSITGDNCL